MLFILFSCHEPTATFAGKVSSAGDSTIFLQRCHQSDPQALILKRSTQTNSCEEAWGVLSSIDTIDISHVEISDLSILSGMTNLKSLSAYDNEITDISPLVPLDRMEELYLVSNRIRDISPLLALRQHKNKPKMIRLINLTILNLMKK